MDIKCKHCRKKLFDGEPVQLLTSHSEIKTQSTNSTCTEGDPEGCLYLSPENIPLSIQRIVDQKSWTKGRIYCEHCTNRIGSFNFVSEMKCNCGMYIKQPIQIIQSKIDILYNDK